MCPAPTEVSMSENSNKSEIWSIAFTAIAIIVVIVLLRSPDSPITTKPDLPITVAWRDSLVGAGKVLILGNTGKSDLRLTLHAVNHVSKESVTHTISIPAGQTREFGWMELDDWMHVRGEEVTLRHPDYKTYKVTVP